MLILGYNVTDDRRKINKNLNNQIIRPDVILKDGTDITAPVFLLQYDSAPKINYVYSSVFNRYYFVDEIRCVRNKLWEIHCSVDVLMSYKDKILASNAFCLRSSKNLNPFLVDPELPVSAKKSKTIAKVSTSDSIHNYNSKMYYVLITAGGTA